MLSRVSLLRKISGCQMEYRHLHRDEFFSDPESRGKLLEWGSAVGTEARKSFSRWMREGFLDRFLFGEYVLDIGYRGYGEDAHPILPWAIGIDLDYPGYDGTRLPFPDNSQDSVFSSHTLEHIPDYAQVLGDWFRVLRPNGHLITIVPHQFLYERRGQLPSRWNDDHRRFYTSASLLREIEEAIDPISFRVRYLEENDRGFSYDTPPSEHAQGCYEIILVLQKIQRPYYADDLHGVISLAAIAKIWEQEDRAFVEGLYRIILRRSPDKQGWEDYVELLGRGTQRSVVLRAFVESREASALGLTIPAEVYNLI